MGDAKLAGVLPHILYQLLAIGMDSIGEDGDALLLPGPVHRLDRLCEGRVRVEIGCDLGLQCRLQLIEPLPTTEI